MANLSSCRAISLPTVNIDLASFTDNPYPILTDMRQNTPICFVPQLGATLLTRHSDIFICEKNVDVFSSDQPGGLMNVLMGQNMMRKDGDAHLTERRQAQPALSPKSVKSIWKAQCEQATNKKANAIWSRILQCQYRRMHYDLSLD